MKLFIGPRRKDGKFPVRCVYAVTGRKLDKIVAEDELPLYKRDADEGVFASTRGARR